MTDENKINRWNEAVDAHRNNDKKAALFLLRSLANDGELASYREIANIYDIGGGGIERDYVEAMKWYKKALDEADDAWGAYGLGRIYYQGNGVDVDYEKAAHYFELAANSELTIADLMLGRMYLYGFGVEKSLKNAKFHLQKAAADGNVYAIKNLSAAEFKSGNIFKGIFLNIKGVLLHAVILLKNKRDTRLRSS